MGNKNLAIFILIATIVAQATWVRAATNLPKELDIKSLKGGAGTFHYVGDDKGWTTGVDYKAWAATKDIRAGENIRFYVLIYVVGAEFNYDTSKHNVVWIGEKEYNECKFEQALIDASGCGYTFWTLADPGTFYFASARGNDCNEGMKLQITVKPK
ncbi:mavicyanin-like [Bidens hawaiensis]|uniref:mavicyanin-like n=1 Tax=Bidens hawaiensis TaxID=980011 RepID=UPI00404A8947